MPELPDVSVYVEALRSRIVGHELKRAIVKSLFLLRSADPPLSATQGRTVGDVRRLGKRIAIGLVGDLWLVLHLKIAGRLHWNTSAPKMGGRNLLASFQFDNGWLWLTEAGTQRRASLHVVVGDAGLQTLSAGGIEPLDAKLAEFIARLYEATRATLTEWTDRLRAESAGEFPEKVTAFRPEMAVHGRYGQPCPRCGAKVQRIRHASNETNYCARCQTGGRLLADRALSRLLHEDWPRTLDELEELKKR